MVKCLGVCAAHTTPKTHTSLKGAQSVHNALLFLLCSTVTLSPRWLGECPASSLCCLRPPPWPRCSLSCCHRVRQRYEPKLAFSHPFFLPVPSDWHHFWFPFQNSKPAYSPSPVPAWAFRGLSRVNACISRCDPGINKRLFINAM